MHLLSIHGVHGVQCDDNSKVAVSGLESATENAGCRVDAGKDHSVNAETTQHKLEVRCIEGAVALFPSDDEIVFCIERRDDFCPMTSGEVVAENPLPRFGRIIVNCFPKGIGCDLPGLSVFGNHVDDADTDGAKLVEEFRGLRDHRTAAFSS